MAATVNDRDLFLSGETRTFPGVIPSDFEFTGNVTGTLNGIAVQEVIDAAYTTGGSGDITTDVLSNSATSILMSSSALFKTTTGAGGVFIGGGGLFGKNTGGTTTFAIDGATGSVSITGALSATSTIDGTTASLIKSGAAVGQTLVNASGQITLGSADKIRAGSGTAGVFFGSSGIFGRNSSGTTTFAIDATNGNVSITGTLSATSVIGSTSASSVEQGAAIGSILPAGSGQITLGSAGKLRTGSGTSRVEFGSTGIFGYSGGVQTFGLSSNGSFSLTGGSVGGAVDIAGTLASVIGPGAANGATLTSGSGSLVLGSSDKIKSGSGTAGVFFGSNGLFGRNSLGQTTFAISSTSGAATFTGDITGGSNLSITGQGAFNGSTSASIGATALVANSSDSAVNGMYGRSTGTRIGVSGFNSGTGTGVSGSSTGGGNGVSGTSSGGAGAGGNFVGIGTGAAGVRATKGSGTGNAIEIIGSMSISSTTLVTNLNADRLDGYHASSFCRTVGSNSGGTATMTSAGRFNIFSSVSGVLTTAAGNDVTIYSSSDEKLKHNINDCKYGLELINKLIPREFSWNHTPDVINHGFIAQEVEKVNDAFIVKNSNGMLGVDQYGLLAVAIKAIQQLTERIEDLENERQAG